MNARLLGSEPQPDAALPPFLGTKNTSGYPSCRDDCHKTLAFVKFIRIRGVYVSAQADFGDPQVNRKAVFSDGFDA